MGDDISIPEEVGTNRSSKKPVKGLWLSTKKVNWMSTMMCECK